MLLKLSISVTERVRQLTDRAARDRGEGPVPYIVLVATIAALAVGIGLALAPVITGWVNRIPK